MLALAKHSLAFYDLLDSRAKREEHGEHHLQVFRGSITKVWDEVGASNSYYTNVMRSLKDMSCIVVLQTGSVNVDSIVACLRRPEPSEFSKPDLTKTPAPATMLQELENIKRNIGGINIPDALQELLDRLVILEREVGIDNGTSQESKHKSN